MDAIDTLKIPRLYQTELLEQAKKRNIIIRADTGTGKTQVALLLIRWMHDQERMRDAKRNQRTIQAFLVPTRPLVYQQAESIKTQTSLNVKAYTGDLQPEFWKIDKWKAELEDVDVIVCTPQIFYDVISKGFWNFEDVSLLVFDEAHHCRKSHVYNQIMQVHYHRLARAGAQRLPKILGLTASPIWDCKSFSKAENDIQILQSDLAARLYEINKNLSDLESHTLKPTETIAYFDSVKGLTWGNEPPWDLVNPILETYAGDKLLSDLKLILNEFGLWALALSIIEWLKSLSSSQRHGSNLSLMNPTRREDIQRVVKKLEKTFDTSRVPKAQTTEKFKVLISILRGYMQKDDRSNFHGIIFVEKRRHAVLLNQLLLRCKSLEGFLRSTALTGHGVNEDPDNAGQRMDAKAQNRTVERFRSGEVNLIVATSVAEEGLDFCACKVVIRFDEITTWKGYIQSRGRARAIHSDFIVILPRGVQSKYLEFRGKDEQLKVKLYDRPEEEVLAEAELGSTPQLICQLPDGKDSILTYNAAPSLLNDVCQLIPHDEFLPPPVPQYETEVTSLGFVSQVTLPPMAALLPTQRVFKGGAMPTKKESKQAAAFQACQKLREVDVLTEHFTPRRNDKVAEIMDANGRKIDDVPIPDPVPVICHNPFGNLWSSSEVWLHLLSFDYGAQGQSRMGFLCANALLDVRLGMSLFGHHDEAKRVAVKVDQVIQMEWCQDERMENLRRLEKFTRTITQAIINRKGYQGDLIFLVSPLKRDSTEIDWELVETPLAELNDPESMSTYPSLVVPLRSFRHRVFNTGSPYEGITWGSEPGQLPDDINFGNNRAKVTKFRNLAHFYAVVHEIPVDEDREMKCVMLQSDFYAMDHLSGARVQPGKFSQVLVPLSFCRGSQISILDWKTYSLLPGLTRLLHDGRQVESLRAKLEISRLPIDLALGALTPPGLGVPWDYQTLETVGDAFLKLATTVHIYLSHQNKAEGDMSFWRSKSVDNAYLRQKAFNTELGVYILGHRYRTDRFIAPVEEDGEKLFDRGIARKIPRRVLSDVVEALLGAGYLSGGISSALQIGTKLDLCFGGAIEWSQRTCERSLLNLPEGSIDSMLTPKHYELLMLLGYEFKNKLWFIQALTHRSANSFLTNCYEREEWLGDALIDFWIIQDAYKRFEKPTAEQLTLARARLVSNGSLGFISLKKLKLQELIYHRSESFRIACEQSLKSIEQFEKVQDFYKEIDNNYVIFDPPKILNDCLESIIGVIFIDSGFDLNRVFNCLNTVFEDVLPFLNQFEGRDPLSRMIRWSQKVGCGKLSREQQMISEDQKEGEEIKSIRMCSVKIHGSVVASGRHSGSSAVAEQRAALEFMQMIEEGANEKFVSKLLEKVGCDCTQKEIKGKKAAEVSSIKSLKQIPSNRNKHDKKVKSDDDRVSVVNDGTMSDDLCLIDRSSLAGKRNRKKRARLNKKVRGLKDRLNSTNPEINSGNQEMIKGDGVKDKMMIEKNKSEDCESDQISKVEEDNSDGRIKRKLCVDEEKDLKEKSRKKIKQKTHDQPKEEKSEQTSKEVDWSVMEVRLTS